MTIKGAFTVRWAPKDGKDGKGVSIVKTEVKYSVGANGTSKPSSGWSTSIPSVKDGQYLWTWTHVEYSDGTKTDAYSVAKQGVDGNGIKSTVVTYSQQETNVSPDAIPEAQWGDYPSSLTDGYWLYTRTVIIYSDNVTTKSYSVSQIGVGSNYAGVEEYYTAHSSGTNAPTGAPTPGTYHKGENISIGSGWSEERPTLTAEKSYIWNFEISYDSRGNRYVTAAICIGNFAKGIKSIVETYAISSKGSAESGRYYPSDIADNAWQDEHFASAPTEEKPYQWNRTKTTYNDDSVQYNYHVSAVKGRDGNGAVYIDLDNESDSLLYDGQGKLVSGNSICNINLYDNGADKTAQCVFSISEKSAGVSASISGTVLTVTGCTANDGYVLVTCTYNKVAYYARYTVKRLVGVDKYEVICTPSAISYNETTDNGKTYSIDINVYRTSQDGTRVLVLTLPDGYRVMRYVDAEASGTAITYNNGKATISPDVSKSRYMIALLDSGDTVLDAETIPISHVKNGNDGVTERTLFTLSVTKPAKPTAETPSGWYDTPHIPSIANIRIEQYQGAAYSFAKSGDWYVSQNKGVNSSTAKARLSFDTSDAISVGFDWNVSSESGWDKGSIFDSDGSTLVDAVSGTKSGKISVDATKGTNSIILQYTKDSGSHVGDDCFKVKPSNNILVTDATTIWCVKEILVDGKFSAWSEPVQWNGDKGDKGEDAKSISLRSTRQVINTKGESGLYEPLDDTDIVITAELQNMTGNVAWTVDWDSLNIIEDDRYTISGNTITLDTRYFCENCDNIYVTATLGGISASLNIAIVAEGQPGKAGSNGKPLVGPTEWDASVSYLSGNGNEAYQSLVINPKYPKQMFLCGFTHSGKEPSANTSASSVESCTKDKPWVMAPYQDFVATKVLFAERAKIGNVDISGTITDETEIFEGGTKIVQDTGNGLKSITVSHATITSRSLIFLPEYRDVKIDGVVEQRAYMQAGTRLSIYTTPEPTRCNWATFPWDMNNSNHRGYYNDLLNCATMVCSDLLIYGYTNDNKDHNVGGGTLAGTSDYQHGRFSLNGVTCRNILLVPGQHLHLISSIERINGTNSLVWSVINAGDFTPCLAKFKKLGFSGSPFPFDTFSRSILWEGDNEGEMYMVPNAFALTDSYRQYIQYGMEDDRRLWSGRIEEANT